MGIFDSIVFIVLSITLLLLFQSQLHDLPIVSAQDTLFPGDELSDTSTLTSSNGRFTLGFCNTLEVGYSNGIYLTYLGIWLTSDYYGKSEIVWISNRDQPIDGDAILTMDASSGTLRVKNQSGATLFDVFVDKVGLGTKNNTTRGKLQDSGNFIVYDIVTNRTIWESFDHPTDALVPGMKLGYNLTAEKNWELTSGPDIYLLTSGAFTMRLQQYQKSPQLLIYRHGDLYWASGPWNDTTRTFQFLEYTKSQFELTYDPSGTYLIVQLMTYHHSSSIMQLQPTGEFPMYYLDFCFGYGSDGQEGCVDAALPQCRALASVNDGVYGWRDLYVGEIGHPNDKIDDNSSISLGDCMERCWNDCDCVSCSTYHNNGTGCIYGRAELKKVDEEGVFRYVISKYPKQLESPKNRRDIVDSLAPYTNLVSDNKMFTLGFFTIPSTNLTYLGIWFTYEQRDIKVWVANRETPVVGQAYFSVDSFGIWKVVNLSGAVFFSTYVNRQVSLNITYTDYLDDTGVLNVFEEANETAYWKSSDPTDTLLSSTTLGYDQRTSKSWTLTSWLSDDVPASGAFTLKFEDYQNTPQLVIYRRGNLYWASGPWNSTARTFQFLSFVNGTRFIFPEGVDLTSVASGMQFSYYSLWDINDPSIMFKLYPNGQFKDVKNQLSLTPEFCYGYESDNGCVVSPLANCRGKTDIFQLRSGDWIGGSSIKDDNSSISHADCTERCWNDCTCTGFNTTNTNGTGCIFWTAYATFRVDESGHTAKIYVLVPPKPPKKKTWVWILVSLAIVLLCVLAFVRIKRCIIKAKENKRRDDFIIQMSGSNSFNYGDELERGVKDAPDVKIFSLKAIMAATNNFSDENKLGQGGYGPVYKGELSDGRKIAVKRLSKSSGQGILEFKNEFVLISKLQHTNLVRLYGCCIHRQEKMLIYEFMPNKSLDTFLFAQDEKDKISWQIRFNIIEGVAQGLLYLHKYSRMKVIHRDLKVDNVLLDDNMNPKITDFGMARIFQQNVNEVATNRVVGTFGYMAPEYIMKGTFSIKSDVFSFGVLILEIVSGRRNSSFYIPDRPLNLVGYAWELWIGHASLNLKDETLGESYDAKQLLRVIHLGLLCVQEKADDRPTMSNVIYILNNENTILPGPKQPAFFTSRQTCGVCLSESNGSVQVSKNS